MKVSNKLNLWFTARTTQWVSRALFHETRVLARISNNLGSNDLGSNNLGSFVKIFQLCHSF